MAADEILETCLPEMRAFRAKFLLQKLNSSLSSYASWKTTGKPVHWQNARFHCKTRKEFFTIWKREPQAKQLEFSGNAFVSGTKFPEFDALCRCCTYMLFILYLCLKHRFVFAMLFTLVLRFFFQTKNKKNSRIAQDLNANITLLPKTVSHSLYQGKFTKPATYTRVILFCNIFQ